jgi:hypothetical protein
LKSKRIKETEYAAYVREMMNSYSVLIRKSEAKRPFGRPKHRLGII